MLPYLQSITPPGSDEHEISCLLAVKVAFPGEPPPPLKLREHEEPSRTRLSRIVPLETGPLIFSPPQLPDTFVYFAAVPLSLKTKPLPEPLPPPDVVPLVLRPVPEEELALELRPVLRPVVDEEPWPELPEVGLSTSPVPPSLPVSIPSPPEPPVVVTPDVVPSLPLDRSADRSFFPSPPSMKASTRAIQTRRKAAKTIAKTREELTRFSLSPAVGVLPVT